MKRQRQLKYQATEKGKACRARWYAKHAEERRTYLRQYRLLNKDKVSEWKADDHRKNKDKYSERYYRNHIRRKYGLSIDQFEVMKRRQNYCCAICEEPFTKTPVVDHCHTTGYIRALLCGSCNSAIGFLRNNHQIALSAAHYLSKEVIFNATVV